MRVHHDGRFDWHLREEIQAEICGYYSLLEGIRSGGCCVQCRGCGIVILTTDSNRDRADLRCEFGCRARHDRECSNERTRAYYQTEEGRKKKRELNARRSRGASPNKAEPLPKAEPPPVKRARRERLLRYYQWLLLVVDGRKLAWEELENLVTRIREAVRQRGLPEFEEINKVPDE